MTHEIFWLIPDKVLYIRYTGSIHIDTYTTGVTQLHETIEQSPYSQVYLIFDIHDVQQIGLSLQQIKKNYRRHPNLKCSMVIKPAHSVAATWAKTIVEVMNHLLGWDHIRIVNTWGDALTGLARKDPSLKDALSAFKNPPSL